MEDELLTIAEVSKILKVNVGFVHKLRKAGILKCMYCGSYKVRKITLLKFSDLNNIKTMGSEEDVTESGAMAAGA